MTTQGAATNRKTGRFPLTVRHGDVEAKIYRTPTTIRGVRYDTFTLCWQLNGIRHRRRFSDLGEARTEAERIAREKSQGALALAAISPANRVSLEASLVELARAEGTGHATPERLVELVREYAAARAALPAGTTLLDAAKEFAARHPADQARITVAEAVQRFLADREAAGCSVVHLRDLEVRLSQFARAFSMPISGVSAPLVQEWLYSITCRDGRPASPRSKKNLIRNVAALFNHCRRTKIVPPELALEIGEIKAPKARPVPIGVYSPDDIRKLLAAADQDLIPALAVGAFAGLRMAELARLDWRDIRLPERVLVVDADKAKTASRRVVPITDNLAAWLVPHVRASGPVAPCMDVTGRDGWSLTNRMLRTAARAGVAWKRNGLRHSCISYAVALRKDVPAVALESGNSPAMIFAHYRALATEAEGQAWFAVRPPQPAENVVPLGMTVAA